MREIKFRAWDGERLRKVNTIGWVDGGVDFVTTPRYSGPAEDFRLMQYTGLKDKNGVDIYEGDVIDYCWHSDSGHRKIIKFCDYYLGYEPFLDDYSMPDDGTVEIIGNIYENPELLECE